MTGGVVVVLGPTGHNFAAGMSGGYAFVYDPEGWFADRCNLEMVHLVGVEDYKDVGLLSSLINRHVLYTGSTIGNESHRSQPRLPHSSRSSPATTAASWNKPRWTSASRELING